MLSSYKLKAGRLALICSLLTLGGCEYQYPYTCKIKNLTTGEVREFGVNSEAECDTFARL
jgi:hypothetical protein